MNLEKETKRHPGKKKKKKARKKKERERERETACSGVIFLQVIHAFVVNLEQISSGTSRERKRGRKGGKTFSR
jgi:hypothetical protein